MGYAASFINQLSDLYDEDGFRELTPGLSAELDTAMETLDKYKHQESWVKYTLATAHSLRELMPEIKPFQIKMDGGAVG